MTAPPIHIDDRISSSNRLPTAQVENEIVLIDQQNGLLYGLDDIGSAIFGMIATPTRVSELCDRLSVEYGAAPEVVQKDVLHLLNAMALRGLVVVIPESTNYCES